MMITKKFIIFSLFLLLILLSSCSPASAWQQSFDGSFSDSATNKFTLTLAASASYSFGNALKCSASTNTQSHFTLADTFPGYLSFCVYGDNVNPRIGIYLLNQAGQTKCTLDAPTIPCTSNSWHKIELIENGGHTGIDVYVDGTLYHTYNYAGGVTGTITTQIWYIMTQTGSGFIYLDNFATSSYINTPKTITEANTNLSFAWTAQLMRSYTDQHQISLYSLTNPTNAGKLATWNIPQDDNTSSSEFGYFQIPRSNLLGNNYGLYFLEMTRGSDVLTDEYFYYDQLANPQGFPEQLFMGTSSVNTDIRDEDNNGGEVESGGSVYLYPDINNPADYTFTYDILTTPNAISTDFSTVYNTSSVNSITLDYTGLSTMSYNVSVDGAQVGQTNGGNTFSHTFTGAGVTTAHAITFAPDYSIPGVWGIVKDSTTQAGLKSATVSVEGTNYSKTVYTDDNGVYYLTSGITAGNTYTITVSKPGYLQPPSQTATTQAGSTTRQDFYLDKIATTSGAGLYYAPHDVAFSVLEYWYSGTGLTGVPYSIAENGTEIKTGSTDSKGMFTGSNMSGGTNYTITLTHNGTNYTEYVEPALSEYTFVLNKEGILHEYCNSWLNLSYTENNGSIAIAYVSNKTLSSAAVTVTAANGTNIISDSKGDQSGSFNFNLSSGDYTIKFNIEAADGSTASQFWTLSSPPEVNLFPASYPTWLKNILYVGIIMIFLLAFGKSKNDVACGSAAVLVSLGYYFEWLSCGFNFVVLIWIIAIGAIYLHYKRTGALG